MPQNDPGQYTGSTDQSSVQRKADGGLVRKSQTKKAKRAQTKQNLPVGHPVRGDVVPDPTGPATRVRLSEGERRMSPTLILPLERALTRGIVKARRKRKRGQLHQVK